PPEVVYSRPRVLRQGRPVPAQEGGGAARGLVRSVPLLEEGRPPRPRGCPEAGVRRRTDRYPHHEGAIVNITLLADPGQKLCELGGGANPQVRPNFDVRPCTDAQGNPTVDALIDFEEFPWPLMDDEWDCVFAHFVLEHVSYRLVPDFLREV